jgi:UDP-glucose 4-epimerase
MKRSVFGPPADNVCGGDEENSSDGRGRLPSFAGWASLFSTAYRRKYFESFFPSMNRVLITGGAGFIGSHLAELLLAEGHSVQALDDLSSGSLANIVQLRRNPEFRFRQGSILDMALVTEAVHEVDVIYHLAASVGVKLVVARQIASIRNNVRGTDNILAAASAAGKKVLLTSTSEVYGRGDREIFSEKDDLAMGLTTKGRWSYACSKALDEYLAFAFRREHGLPVTVVRLFNTVGERQSSHYGMVLPTFVKQALAQEALTIHGDGRQSRCFCYVGDVVRALRQLMEHPASDGEIYNIGATESITIEELADRVIRLTESTSAKVYVPYAEAYAPGFEDVTKRVPDILKIQRLIGFRPSLNLDGIIARLRDALVAGRVQSLSQS